MTLNVAILGAGIGREHLAAYLKLPNLFNVLYLVDLDIDRAKQVVGNHSIDVIDDVDLAISDADVDLIDICLPPHLHVPVALQALKGGKNVICEKPLCTSLAEADALIDASARAGKTIYPVFQYRWGPALSKLRFLRAQGLTGEPQIAAIETHWSRGPDYYAVPWRGTWSGERGGAVLGHAIHNHDLLTHFMGPIASLSALLATRINPIETEDCASISFQMENGGLATSSITLGAAKDETRLRFVFEHLTATSGATPYAPGTGTWHFTARMSERQEEIDQAVAKAPDEPIGFEGFLTEIAKHANGQSSAHVTVADGRSSVELVTAIYHAARSGERVALPLSPEHPLYGGWQP